MADPLTIGSMALSGAQGVVGAIGAGQSAAATSKAYQYKAQIAQFNKQVNEQNARWALDSGEISSMESGLKSRQEIANTKVVQADSGFDVNTGTNEVVREGQQSAAAFDQNVIRWDASKTSFGYLTKAQGDEMEANLDTMAASNAEKAGTIAEISSFLGGASSVASKWQQGKTIGMFSTT